MERISGVANAQNVPAAFGHRLLGCITYTKLRLSFTIKTEYSLSMDRW